MEEFDCDLEIRGGILRTRSRRSHFRVVRDTLAMNAEQAAGLRHIFFLEFAGTPFAWLAMAFVRCITHSRVDD